MSSAAVIVVTGTANRRFARCARSWRSHRETRGGQRRDDDLVEGLRRHRRVHRRHRIADDGAFGLDPGVAEPRQDHAQPAPGDVD